MPPTLSIYDPKPPLCLRINVFAQTRTQTELYGERTSSNGEFSSVQYSSESMFHLLFLYPFTLIFRSFKIIMYSLFCACMKLSPTCQKCHDTPSNSLHGGMRILHGLASQLLAPGQKTKHEKCRAPISSLCGLSSNIPCTTHQCTLIQRGPHSISNSHYLYSKIKSPFCLLC